MTIQQIVRSPFLLPLAGSGSVDIGGASGQKLYCAGNFSCINGLSMAGPNTTEPRLVFNGTGSKTFGNTSNQGNFEVNSSTLTVTVTTNLAQGGSIIEPP